MLARGKGHRLRRHDVVANALALLVGLAVCTILLAAAEMAVRAFGRDEPPTLNRFPRDYYITDSAGITKPLPDGRYRFTCTARQDGSPIYDVVYSVDPFSRRVTPVSDPHSRDKFLLFFGCSFTYGEGLPDDQTFPYYVARAAASYMPYNYAFHGHSPAELLVKMETGTLPREVPEAEGTLIYLLIDAQFHRVVGSMRFVSTWGKNRPYYTLDTNGRPLHRGDFTSGRPRLTRFYSWLARSRLLSALDVDLPPRIMDRHIRLMAEIFGEAKRLYQLQFPRGEFVVVLYPGSRDGLRLAPLLERMGISVVDYSTLFDPWQPANIIAPLERHPSALACQTLAQEVVRDLRLQEASPVSQSSLRTGPP